MSDQLQLDLTAPATEPAGQAATPFVGQLRDLPGSKWEHIFDMPAPDDEDET